MNITRITRKPVDIPFTVTLTDGNPATPTGVQVAVLNRRDSPTAATVWTDAVYIDGTVTVTVAGPDATPGGALVIPEAGADVWGKVSDASYVDAIRLMNVRVEGGGNGGLPVPTSAALLDTAIVALLNDPTSATYARVLALIEARTGFGAGND